MAPDATFNSGAMFMGAMFASPLYLENGPGGTGVFFAVTTNNNVHALHETTGVTVWTRNIGAPATANVGCFGNNGGIPTLGILATPVIDAAARTIFVAGATGGAQGVMAQVASAINVDDGTVRAGWPVNVSTALSFDPAIHNQRSALSLVGGILYVAYGGYVGDCGTYRGRVVAINAANPATMGGWATAGQGEGIWTPGGMASDGNGVFAVTGNRTGTAGGGHQDSEEVVRITGMGTKADYFFPTNWMTMDGDDSDFGSVSPVYVQLPGATPSNIVVAIAKDGHMYLLDAAQLRGTSTAAGGQKVDFMVATGPMAIHTVPGAYRTAQGLYVMLSTTNGASGCPGGGMGRQVISVRIAPGNPPVPTVAWCAPMMTVTTGPIATTTDGQSEAIVWFMSAGRLVGVDGDTGAQIVSSMNTCSGVQRWTSPIAVKGRIIAGGDNHLCSWSPQ
jgi:hypothetical protein